MDHIRTIRELWETKLEDQDITVRQAVEKEIADIMVVNADIG